MAEWGTPSGVDMSLSWPDMPPLPKPINPQEGPWGNDRPSAPSETNLSSKKVVQDSWGQNRSENSYMSRNEIVQVDHFAEKSFPGRGPTTLSDNLPPVNMRPPPGIDKINDQREDDEEYASLAYQVVAQQSFESHKENKERHSSEVLEDDNWDPDYHNIPVSDSSQLDMRKAKSRVESSITASTNSTFSKKEFRDIAVQTDQIDLTKIIASKEKLLSCTLDSQFMRDYQQDVSEKRHPPQQSVAPSLLDLGPDEWNNTFNKRENSWNRSSGKDDFRDNIIPPTISETNAREPDSNSRKPIQAPPNNGPQPAPVQANGLGAPTQDNAYSQPVRDIQSNKNDRSQGPPNVSNDNLSVQQPKIEADSWGSGPQTGDWMKQREMIEKELGISNTSNTTSWEQTKDKRTEESHGTFKDSSSSNNRYGSRDGNRDGNRYGSRMTCNNCGEEGHFARECTNESSRGGFGSGLTCHKCGKEGHFARDCTNESSRGGFGSGLTCHKCGKEGHIARDCTNESSRGGYGSGLTCHKCGKEGHVSRECPTCYRCNKPGHHANECNEDAYETTGQDGSFGGETREFNPTKFSPYSKPGSDISSEDAWAKLLEADKKEDIDDFKEALNLYAKVTPVETFQSIEKKLRDSNCKARIIALKREEIPLNQVLKDLQGNTNKRYVATPFMVPPSHLPRTAGERAQSEEENFAWLADAGVMVDDPGPICHNCKQKGHSTWECKEPKREMEKPSHLKCQNCGSLRHETKHCDEERRDFYTEARDRKAVGSYNRDPVNDDKASSIYGGEEDRKGFRGHGSSSSQTCHNCHREGHKSFECPERRSGGGRKCYKCNEEGHLSKDCDKGGNYDDYNKTTSLDTYSDNSRSKTGGDDTSRKWDNNNAQNREVRNDVTRDSSLSTQDKDKPHQQKDTPPYNTEKGNPVEPDSWEKPVNTIDTNQQGGWGYKTLQDFNWETSNSNNKEVKEVSDKYNKGTEDYENKREDPYNKVSDEYRGRGNDYSYNKGSDDYNRRGRGNNNSYNNQDDYGDRRGRSSNSYNKGDDYGRGRGNDSYNRSDEYGRSRGSDSYNRSYDDYGRGRNDSYNRSDDYERRGRGNNSYNNSDDYERRGRGGNSYNNDYGRGRSSNSYNKGDDYGRGRGNDSYNRSDEYGRSRGSDSYNRGYDDYGRGRNDSYNNRSDDYGRGRGNDSYNRSSDDYGRNRGGNPYNNDYGRSRGNDSYNKGSGDYGRNRGNDYSYNRGSEDYDGRWTKSKSQEPREQTSQPNANVPGPNLDNVQTWW